MFTASVTSQIKKERIYPAFLNLLENSFYTVSVTFVCREVMKRQEPRISAFHGRKIHVGALGCRENRKEYPSKAVILR